MIILPEYKIIKQIYTSDRSLVYRARDEKQRDIIIKILKQEYPTREELTKYKQEFVITQNLNADNVISSYRWEEYQNTLAIVFEDFGGISLDILLKKVKLTIKEFLEIAIKITSGLAGIHAANIIHKDINPSNIVFNPETKQLKIIDFGISTVLPKENPTIKNPNTLEGTLAYISPEQTGRMNCSLDYRSDFYSLGVTFYELLTQQLPYQSKDLLELIHSHIAKKATPPEKLNPEIPKAVSELILKLMAKNANERYQSAWGIKADLEICLARLENEAKKFQFHFQLGKQDISAKFQISQKLYGREKEIDTLLKAIEQRKFQREIILISGYSGIGKSALVREVYKPITEAKGYFITGKFDQYQRDRPYSAITQAFSQLAKYLLAENKNYLDFWKNKLLEVLKDNGQVIIDLIPEIEPIIGKQPPATNLAAAEAQNRFNFVFLRFVKVFTRKEHPLVIFLDDLQWADSASLQLIELLMTDDASEYLFLIGAYRDNEVSQGHPLLLTINKLREAQVNRSEICLSALKLSDVAQLIADSFNCSRDPALQLAKLIHTKTKGNPFFINKFLRSLYRENLLSFNYKNRTWQWNLREIEERDITDNVVELLSRSIQKLDIETQKILQLAACIGNQFAIKTLATIGEKLPQETALLLRSALEVGLVFPLSDAYKSIELNVSQDREKLRVEYKFVHDRIQQAAYSLIPQESQAKLHQKIGKLLLKSAEREQLEENIFEIVNQLNLAVELLSSQSEKDELAKLNLIAGQKAKLSAAYKAAFEYLKLGHNLLGENPWDRNYKLTLELYLAAAEVASINRDYNRAEQWSNEIIKRAKNLIDRSQGYKTKVSLYLILTEHSKALEIGILVLNELGLTIPKRKIWLEFNLLFQIIRHKFISSNNFIARIKKLPRIQDPNLVLLIEFLKDLGTTAYLSSPKTYLLLTLKRVDFSLKYGIYYGSCYVFLAYAVSVCWILDDIDLGYQIARESLLLEKNNNNNQYNVVMLSVFNILIAHAKEHLNKTLEPLLEGYLQGLELGDLSRSNSSMLWYLLHSFIIGKKLEELEKDTVEYIKIISSKIKIEHVRLFVKFIRRTIEHLRCPDLAKSFIKKKVYFLEEDEVVDRINDVNMAIFNVYENFYLLFCYYLFGEYIKANNCANKGKEKISSVLGMAIIPVFYFYDSLNKIALIDRDKLKYKKFFKEITKNQQKIKKLAHHAPMNYQHKYDLVAAELHRVKGNKAKAADLYEKAINGARKNEYIQEEALANELTAKFYLEWNKPIIAKVYIMKAYYKYELWGAIAKVKHLEENYPELLDRDKIRNSDLDIITTVSGKNSSSIKLDTLDLATILKTNKALSSELDLAKLLKKLIEILTKSSGAQKSCLILFENEELTIEALKTSESEEVKVLQSIPIDAIDEKQQTTFLAVTIVNYVARTLKTEILDNAINKERYQKDPYIITTKPKSILCIPLINQSNSLGLVYLENNLILGAFPKERIQAIEAIASQAAISIQNARLYKETIEAEAALKEKDKQLTKFIEAMPVGVFISNSKGEPYYLNQMAQQIVGKGLESVKFEQIAEVYNIYDSDGNNLYPHSKSPIIKALKGETTYTSDIEIRRNDIDGKTIPIDTWTTPIKNDREDIEFTITAFQDVSERKKAKQELEEINRTLDQKVKERTKELRNTVQILKETQKKLVFENQALKESEDLKYYHLGGKVPHDSPSYVIRYADVCLGKALREGEYSYVFNARTMGKSSLLARAMKELKSRGIKCAEVDMSRICSPNLTLEQWYLAIIDRLSYKLKLLNKVDYKKWWSQYPYFSPFQRFDKFFQEIILSEIDSEIVIFFDEIDSILNLKFNVDDFFVLIRSFYNARASSPEFERLNFVFLGVASPFSLIRNKERTPFNIGRAIVLEPFELYQVNPLIQGLVNKCANPENILKEVLFWTGGQPFLTQKMCLIISEFSDYISAGKESIIVEDLVKKEILENWEFKDEPQHLRTIRDRLLSPQSSSKELLKLYRQLLEDKEIILSESSPLHLELLLTGLAYRKEGKIELYNRIYETIFDREWVTSQLEKQ